MPIFALIFLIISSFKAFADEITVQTKSSKYNYEVEIAKTEQQQEQGLMYRKSMPKNNGMLFLFNPAKKIAMWMKNTYISLDMLFIDNNGKIIYIMKNAAPNSLNTISAGDAMVSAVLELNAGEADAKHFLIGDKIIAKVSVQ